MTASVGNRLPRRSRDRRAALSALALLLVVLGALGSALVVYRSGHRSDVLVAAHDIQAGDRITRADFATARVASDSSAVLPTGAESNFLGTYAINNIPGGTLLNHEMFQAGNVIPKSGVVVGIPLSASQAPASGIATGDVVRAFYLPPSSSDNSATPGQVLVPAARVVDVTSDASSTSATTTVSILVGEQDAQDVIAAASANQVALGELPKSVTPPVDFRKSS